MPIRLRCPDCDKPLRVADDLAGRRVRCPHCRQPVQIPSASVSDEPRRDERTRNPPQEPPSDDDDPELSALYGELADAPLPPKVPRPAKRRHRSPNNTFVPVRDGADDEEEDDDDDPPRRRSTSRTDAPGDSAPGRSFLSRGSAHWLLLAALVPLAISVFVPNEPIAARLERTLLEHPELADRFAAAGEGAETDLFSQLPGQRLVGAHLGRRSQVHWLYAGLSAAAFLGLLCALAPRSSASIPRLLVAGVVTGTVGIVLLLLFQALAGATQDMNLRGRSIVVLLFHLVKLVGFSYRCALDPANGFLASFFGFTCGVGLCEELCKALPVVIYLRTAERSDWQGAMLVGLASGVGFGVSEGVMYAADHYNGLAGGTIYVVRFVSCVGLHAIWAGAVGMLIQSDQSWIDGFDWENAAMFVVAYLGIAMALHGLYDTLLKKDHEIWALAIAAGSFGWFAWLLKKCRTRDAE